MPFPRRSASRFAAGTADWPRACVVWCAERFRRCRTLRRASPHCAPRRRGEREAAAIGFADAAARWHDFDVPYEEAQALLGQGRCLVALDRDPEAALPLRRSARDLRASRRQAGSGGDREDLMSLAGDAGQDS